MICALPPIDILESPQSNPLVKVGDCMLYFSKDSVADWIIAVKTWSKISHVEIYVGYFKHQGQLAHWSVASRNGIGVGLYKTRWDGLVCIREPFPGGDIKRAMDWFWDTANGQKYDWLGLMCFTLAVAQGSPDKMFCSEFATHWYRHYKRPQFNTDVDADRVPPMYFWVSRQLRTKFQIGSLH